MGREGLWMMICVVFSGIIPRFNFQPTIPAASHYIHPGDAETKSVIFWVTKYVADIVEHSMRPADGFLPEAFRLWRSRLGLSGDEVRTPLQVCSMPTASSLARMKRGVRCERQARGRRGDEIDDI